MGDIFWSSGLPPRVAESTKPAFYPGTNQLGHLLESVRFELMKEVILCKNICELPLHSVECIPTDILFDITSCEINITHSLSPSPSASTSSPKGTTLPLIAVSPPHNVPHPTILAPPSPSCVVVVVYPLPWPLLVGGVRCSRLWSTSQLLRPSGQQCSHSGGVCPQIQGRQCGAYVGEVEEMMCVVCVDVTEGA